jgi:hypothetical protein
VNSVRDLSLSQILAWADAHHERTGRWPSRDSGPIQGAPGETWAAVNAALSLGVRGLLGGSSLARVLAAERGAGSLRASAPRLRRRYILAWADAHFERTGAWPTRQSGPVVGAPGETWYNLQSALCRGARGLPGRSSLAQFLGEERGKRNHMNLPPLRIEPILSWADAYHERTGRWPTADSGPVAEAPEETWSAVDAALRDGKRGLAIGSSLARLLAEKRGVRNSKDLSPLTPEQILAWADAHFRRTGKWPTSEAGPVVEAPGETWLRVSTALQKGQRGLPGGSSLARLLEAERGVRNEKNLPPYTAEQILTWADAHHRRTGRWPTVKSGPIEEAPGETWMAVQSALDQGKRGLPGGSSLARLLEKHRGKRHHKNRPQLQIEPILTWADAYHERTGHWPTRRSGPIPEAPGESWSVVSTALHEGLRGLPRGPSLARLLSEHHKHRDVAGSEGKEAEARA